MDQQGEILIMKKFMDKDFLLTTETAKILYHKYAAECPIVDYHNHLPAKEIYERKTYDNITQVWLAADHYKWRCMRVNGVDEFYITGEATDREKFQKFAEVMPSLIGSPVYHWAHLELQRYFGIETPLNGNTAEEIWNKTAEILKTSGFDTVSLLNKANVRALCTTDDPADDLMWHIAITEDPEIEFKVLPSFRPDRFLHIDQPTWAGALKDLGRIYDEITDWRSLTKALRSSLDFFEMAGCRITDHGFIKFRYGEGDPDIAMSKVFSGETLTETEIAAYQGALLRWLAAEYNKRDLTMQLHLGPIRNNSPRLMEAFGADAGGDSIGMGTDPFQLSAFLSAIEEAGDMPKTILYNLNPVDSGMLATMAANFGARVQYGAAWWLLDHIRGINEQIDQLMETGMLAKSVGMLTDSRSFTSFVRHEYYRRIVCEKIGNLVESGQYPDDIEFLGEMVRDICFKNAETFIL